MFQYLKIRSATISDKTGIDELMNSGMYVHRHLDWRTPTDWLGKEPFFVMENPFGICSTLACIPEPEGIGWIRLFATTKANDLQDDWNALFSRTLEYFRDHHVKILPAMGIHEWFTDLLVKQGFHFLQNVVVLKWNTSFEIASNPDSISLRPVAEEDIRAITEVDNQAFEPLWQIPLSAMTQALKQSAYATVALVNGKIVGYQLSTSRMGNAHLARLAVLPAYQGHSIGQFLVQDLLSHFSNSGIEEITVNTQSDNASSLALYKKMNFQPTGEIYPVFLYTM
jgi:ribosomal protein S18 acetylase RimI-like enzyme